MSQEALSWLARREQFYDSIVGEVGEREAVRQSFGIILEDLIEGFRQVDAGETISLEQWKRELGEDA